MPRITISVPYDVLEKVMKAYPNLPPEEALRLFIINSLSKAPTKAVATAASEGAPSQVRSAPSISKEDLMRLQRSIQDLLNPYSAKVDALARRLGDVISLLETLIERVGAIEEEVKRLKEQLSQQVQPPPVPTTRVPPHRERGREKVRRSAVEILKEQKVMFESDIASKIKNRDAFFERLKRDGAVILELVNERVAVDPDFWEEFRRKLSQLRTNNEAEISKVLGPEGLSLLKALTHSAQAYYDATKKMWVLLL